ncbi:MAG: tRNA 2-selenouridine(34) synthase MnmH [Burkholderiaceae bacterium]
MKEPQTVEINAISDLSAEFDDIIDVRSPGEFAIDHLPGAVNFPVLSDAERAQVGTVNAEQSSFDANRLGAALVSGNISRLLSGPLATKSRQWRPLVYCWRGGNRSGSLATVLARIGYRTQVLDGGYRAYRRWVVQNLPILVQGLDLRVIAGRTGSGKSRILDALAERDAQVLDLEALANHRGSVLGLLPGKSQPSQKQFESRLREALAHLDRNKPVYVESESRKIGQVQVPESLITQMRASRCHVVNVPVAARAAFLMHDYDHFVRNPSHLIQQLERLRERYGNEQLTAWAAKANGGEWNSLVEELLTTHYDPSYDRSMARNYQNLGSANQVYIDAIPKPGPKDFSLAALAIQQSDKEPGNEADNISGKDSVNEH